MVHSIFEDSKGVLWFSTNAGLFSYVENQLINVSEKLGIETTFVNEIFEDSKGNIWIGTYFGGVSKYDGKKFINYTKDGIIKGIEAYNFCEDNKGNIWFSVENIGVYSYDGENFTLFTSKDGLASNTIQSIMADNKGQIWFATWSGISIYDGKTFTDARDREPWLK